VAALESRFPDSDFLTALDIIDPSTWSKGLDLNSGSSIALHLPCANTETQMTSEYLDNCDVLQSQFGLLLTLQSPLRSQFQDFLRENFMFLKDKSESQFMNFMINQKFNGVYDDFIR
jgi:hypothetical protein